MTIKDDQSAAVALLASIAGVEATIGGHPVRIIPSEFTGQGDLNQSALFESPSVSVTVPIATFSGIIHPGETRATFAARSWKASAVTTHMAHLEVDFTAD